jgi:hypothetical protein
MNDGVKARDLGLRVSTSSGYEEHVFCPFHDDHNASASWNYRKGMFYCQVCKSGFNLRQITNRLSLDLAELSNGLQFNSESFKLELFRKEEKFPPTLPLSKAQSSYLLGRKLKSQMLSFFNGSIDGKSVIIEPTDYNGTKVCSISRVMTAKKGQPRYYVVGEKPALWPMNQLMEEYSTLILVEGIFSRLLLAQTLAMYPLYDDVGVFSLLGSSLKESELKGVLEQTLNKRIVFLFDNDFAGEVGATSAKDMFPMAEVYTLTNKLDEISLNSLDKFVHKLIAKEAKIL